MAKLTIYIDFRRKKICSFSIREEFRVYGKYALISKKNEKYFYKLEDSTGTTVKWLENKVIIYDSNEYKKKSTLDLIEITLSNLH